MTSGSDEIHFVINSDKPFINEAYEPDVRRIHLFILCILTQEIVKVTYSESLL